MCQGGSASIDDVQLSDHARMRERGTKKNFWPFVWTGAATDMRGSLGPQKWTTGLSLKTHIIIIGKKLRAETK